MLDLLRRKAQSTVIQVIIVAIILVFVFWGVGGQQGAGVNSVATVNDVPISYVDFQRAYDQQINQLSGQFGGNIPAGLLETLGIKEQVLDGLIQRTLVSLGASETGLLASDVEVRNKIQEMEAFKQNGAFDVGWYKQILAGNRMTPTEFEESMKADLLTTKVMDHINRFGGVADSELRDRFNFDYRQKQFSYVALEAADFEKKVEIKDDELAAFFDERKDDYRGEPQLKLKYVLFPFDEKADLKVPEEAILKYFDQHKNEYVVPEKRRARHILIKVEAGDSEEAVTEKRKKAEGLLKQVREGADFASLARKNSEDKGSGIRGGDLGFFGRGQMVKPFEDAVFGMKEDDITLVRSEFGFHVIKLDKINPLMVRTVDEVRDSIVATIKSGEVKDLAFKQAKKAYEDIILAGSLDKYAEAGGTLKETDFFTRGKAVEPLKSDPRFLTAAFGLKQGELSSLVEGEKSYAIFFAQEIKEPESPELDKVRKTVEKDFTKKRSEELAKEAAEAMLAAISEGASMVEEAGKLKLKVEESPMLSRVDRAGSRLAPALLDSGMELSEANPHPENIVTVGNTFYVTSFKDAKEASEEKFAEKKEELREKLLTENRNAALVSWVAFLRDRAEVEIDPRF
jgi:peptidyl-prolyl cis-trans isomerase D